MGEDGPFEIWSLCLSVHQDLCRRDKKNITTHSRKCKNDTYKAHLHSENTQSNLKITERTYFESQALCKVSAMAYAGISIEDEVSPVNYIHRNIPTTLKLSFLSCLFLFPPSPPVPSDTPRLRSNWTCSKKGVCPGRAGTSRTAESNRLTQIRTRARTGVCTGTPRFKPFQSQSVITIELIFCNLLRVRLPAHKQSEDFCYDSVTQ